MPPTNPEPPFEVSDFSYEFFPAMNFGEEFSFGGDFSFLPALEVDFLTNHLSVMSRSHMMMCLAVFQWRVSFHLGRRSQSNANRRSTPLTTPATEQV